MASSGTKGLVSIDTCSWSNLGSNDGISRLAQRLLKDDLKLCVSGTVLGESLAGGKPVFVRARAETLRQLILKIGKRRIAFLRDIGEQLTMEYANPVTVERLLKGPEHDSVLDAVLDTDHMANLSATKRDEFVEGLSKKTMAEHDLAIVKKVSQNAKLVEVAKNHGNLYRDNYGAFFPLVPWKLDGICLGDETRVQAVLSDPKKFPCHAALGAYNEHIAMAGLFKGAGEAKIPGFGLHEGNWVDAMIASASATCDYLISEDVALKIVSDRIREILPNFPKVFKLEEFCGGVS